jgi:DNA repair protein RecO (recombination protein O)
VIVKTEAVVLKWIRHGETSKIVTLLTEDFGKITVIAKGARSSGTRYGRELDSLNHVHVVFYMKEGRDLHLLSQCTLIRHFGYLTADLRRLGNAMSALELACAVTPAGGECRELFGTLLGALNAMNDREAHDMTILLHFETRLLEILGFRPDLRDCSVCRKPLGLGEDGTKSVLFRLSPGGLVCRRCGSGGDVRGEPLLLLQTLQGIRESAEAGAIDLDRETGLEARSIIWHFLRHHVDEIRKLRSEAVFSAL